MGWSGSRTGCGEAAEETTLSIGLCACVHGGRGGKDRAGRAARKATEGKKFQSLDKYKGILRTVEPWLSEQVESWQASPRSSLGGLMEIRSGNNTATARVS